MLFRNTAVRVFQNLLNPVRIVGGHRLVVEGIKNGVANHHVIKFGAGAEADEIMDRRGSMAKWRPRRVICHLVMFVRNARRDNSNTT